MLRSSVAPRMNCSRQGGGIPRQPRAGDPAATRNGLHVRVHLRAAQPGSKLAHVGALPIAARPGTAVGGWTEVRVVNRYTRQFAGRTSTSRGGLIRSIDVLSTGCHPSVPAGSSAQLMSPIDEGEPP
jgi:hypothetical protein